MNGPEKNVAIKGYKGATREFYELLKDCTVIEGSLIISMGDFDLPPEQEEKFYQMSFPDLREVTDYVLIYQTNNIKTLATLFPNLTVIRGNHLLKVSLRLRRQITLI